VIDILTTKTKPYITLLATSSRASSGHRHGDMTRRQRQSKRVTAKVIGAGTIPGARGLQIAPLAYVVSGDRKENIVVLA
jgi:hypothetical protein